MRPALIQGNIVLSLCSDCTIAIGCRFPAVCALKPMCARSWVVKGGQGCDGVAVMRSPLMTFGALCPSLQGASKVVSGDGEGVLGIYTWGLWGDVTDRSATIGSGAVHHGTCRCRLPACTRMYVCGNYS